MFKNRDLFKAGLEILPHIPRLVKNNLKLISVMPNDIMSTGLMLERNAEITPEKIFLIFENKKWTYTEFNDWVNQLAHLFKKNGVGRGECIALMFTNKPELLACVFAINKIGAIAGLINYNLSRDVLKHSIDLINPSLIIVDQDCIGNFETISSEIKTKVYCSTNNNIPFGYFNLSMETINKPKSNIIETRNILLSEKCYYVFTSGTTGLPKAATMTHLRWYKAGLGIGKMAMRLKSTDIMYCALPLYHNNALTVALSSVVCTGATIVLSRKFSVSNFWEDIRKYNVTSFIYVGELCRYLLNAPKNESDSNNNLRVIVGNGMRPEIWEEFKSRFKINHICEFYGASENSTAFINLFNLNGTAGFCPMSYAVVKFDIDNEVPLLNKNNKMSRVNKNEIGLLLTEVSYKIPFDGYSDKNETEKKLFRNVFKNGDCWFNTGDLVREQGYRHVSFIDRVGDTFRWKGENVATTEIEGVVNKIEYINEAIAYGVILPKMDGRAGMISIVLHENKKFNGNEFYDFLKKHLPSYAIPLFVRIIKESEKTGTFKVKKNDLKREGFNILNINDPVFVLLNSAEGYKELTTNILDKIKQNEYRF